MIRKFGSPRTLLSLAFLSFGVVFLLGPILTGRALLWDADVLYYYYPVKTAIHELFRHGASLVWNPLMGEGQPLAANPEHELFYPFTWLSLLFPVAPALAISQAAHVVLCWLGVYRLLRRLRCSVVAAQLGAVIWTFGGLFTSSIHFLPIVYAWTWVPWLMSELVLPSPSVARCALFGAMVLLVGEPVTTILAVLAAITGFALRKMNASRVRRAAAAGALSLLLAAAILVPGAALARKGVRGKGIAEAEALRKSLPPLRLIELALPRATGDTVPTLDRDYLGWRLYPERSWPFFTGLYSGAVLLPLLLAGSIAAFRRARFFLAVAGVALVLALGRATPAWSVLRRLFFPWRMFRFPEKFFALALFLATIVAAIGFDRARRSPRLSRWVGIAMTAFGAICAGLGLLAVVASGSVLDLSRIWVKLPIENAGVFYRGVLIRAGIVNLVIGTLFMALSRARGRARAMFAIAIVGVTAVELCASSRDFVRTRSLRSFRAPPPVVRRLRNVTPVPRLVDFLPESPPVHVSGMDDRRGPWAQNRLYGKQAVGWGIPLALDEDYDVTYLAASVRARNLLLAVSATNMRNFAGLLAARSDGALLIWNTPVTLANPVSVAGVPGVRPEVDGVPAIVRFDGDAEFIRKARESPIDLSRAAFVEGDARDVPDVPAAATIRIRLARNDFLDFTVDSLDRSLVRIARTNDGNWRASIDGRPAALRTIDLSLIGIVVPAGRHDVSVRYDDPLLKIGAAISVTTALLLLAAIGFSASKRKPDVPASP